MGFLDRLFGSEQPKARAAGFTNRTAKSEDERALERYRYLLNTAPPETIEQVHSEAFARLTDNQRALIYEELSKGAVTGERPLSSEPETLARAATRAEVRNPGSVERILSNANNQAQQPGPTLGTMFAGSMLGTVAGYVVGSALMSAFLPWGDSAGAEPEAGAADGGDAGSDFGSSEFGASDFGDFGF
ncbi:MULTISPECIES: hypothetical protein [unclassified Salinibacterium]|uniref:hypothetical protein n=1 Tax=unclassified Salinibacterium TaxID=2632331 RepID=UPI00142241BF|nr:MULTISPECIES: hypothetical protein [unclassified Salinibacterium]